MPRAVVLGGGGFIGSNVTRTLINRGWDVTVAGLGAPAMTQELGKLGASVHNYPRADTQQLLKSVGDGADAFIDIIAYQSQDARQLEMLRGLVGSLVVISTGAVYCGRSGRTFFGNFDTADRDAPELLRESDPTVAPDDSYYGGGKAAVEHTVQELGIAPTTIVRPFAVFGPASNAAREWYFVKRVLDRRPTVTLSGGGRHKFNRCSVDNLAEIVALACEQPKDRTINAADHDPADVRDIAREVADILDWTWTEILWPGEPPSPVIGYTPWSTPARLIADMSAASTELGYRPVTTCRKTLEETVMWLKDYIPDPGSWEEKLPGYVARNGRHTFSYAEEDSFIRWLAGPKDSGFRPSNE
ncbi:MAG: NAD-dependent epimerase/dehydratase family protein [Gordonia sp. (in: high G+C Gram-positive bacteria)]|uniref:NAD-dependent epimerase/dehydratase family protein n=1 Tax=Gordonia sp. (in: high G+C Gram-positive bacteria) TaxID=84139 RepID=UPI003BB72068